MPRTRVLNLLLCAQGGDKVRHGLAPNAPTHTERNRACIMRVLHYINPEGFIRVCIDSNTYKADLGDVQVTSELPPIA